MQKHVAMPTNDVYTRGGLRTMRSSLRRVPGSEEDAEVGESRCELLRAAFAVQPALLDLEPSCHRRRRRPSLDTRRIVVIGQKRGDEGDANRSYSRSPVLSEHIVRRPACHGRKRAFPSNMEDMTWGCADVCAWQVGRHHALPWCTPRCRPAWWGEKQKTVSQLVARCDARRSSRIQAGTTARTGWEWDRAELTKDRGSSQRCVGAYCNCSKETM